MSSGRAHLGPFKLSTYRVDPSESSKTANGRLRTANPFIMRDWHFVSGKLPLRWNEQTSGSGNATHIFDRSLIKMEVTSSQGDEVIRQSKDYINYTSGKSHLWAGTSVFGDNVQGITKKTGIFDNRDGAYWEQDVDGKINLVIRSSVTGSIKEIRIPQSDWNINNLLNDGTNPLKLKPQNINSYLVNYTWYGPGSVRFGVLYGGRPVWVHEYNIANEQKNAWTHLPSLPSRFQIKNENGSSSPDSILHGASAIIEDGARQDDRGITRSISNEVDSAANISSDVFDPIIAVRPKKLFNGNINRNIMNLVNSKLYVSTEPTFYQLLYNPSISATWSSVSANSIAEYALQPSISNLSGGEVIGSDIISADNKGGTGKFTTIRNALVAARGIDIDSFDVFALRARTLTQQATTGYGVIKWSENP